MTGIHGDQNVNKWAKEILSAYSSFYEQFALMTEKAKQTFDHRDWVGVQVDAKLRLGLYGRIVDYTAAQFKKYLETFPQMRPLWKEVKKQYSVLNSTQTDQEQSETFFNSITRRTFSIVGVDPDIEFITSDYEKIPHPEAKPVFTKHPYRNDFENIFKEILINLQYDSPFQNIDRDLAEVKKRILNLSNHQMDRFEMINAVFYRNKGAYLVGRVVTPTQDIPLVFILLNNEKGIFIDAVLLTVEEISIAFSFSNSYFHVQVEHPSALVNFLKQLMPLKPISELYIAIGFHKHGKTELYRDLMNTLKASQDQFHFAPGIKGMVMIAFTLPTFDVVFKVIKDSFDFPKTTTPEKVKEKYRLVFNHDRVGRLVDAQEYEYLTFNKKYFSEALLKELLISAKNSVTIQSESIVIKHLYTERKLIPLNIYINVFDEASVKEALMEYGNAIKDLANANIFAGDIFLKNFGVTRHGRVIFYDYDELCLLTDCHFRKMPPPQDQYEEMAAEPWYHVAENDIFPEEFKTFIGLPESLKKYFESIHGDLFNAEFWINTQNKIKAGEVIDDFPYRPQNRLIHP